MNPLVACVLLLGIEVAFCAGIAAPVLGWCWNPVVPGGCDPQGAAGSPASDPAGFCQKNPDANGTCHDGKMLLHQTPDGPTWCYPITVQGVGIDDALVRSVGLHCVRIVVGIGVGARGQ